MNPLDLHVITFLNQFAHRSWTFDYFVLLLSQNYVLKTGMITACWAGRGFGSRKTPPGSARSLSSR